MSIEGVREEGDFKKGIKIIATQNILYFMQCSRMYLISNQTRKIWLVLRTDTQVQDLVLDTLEDIPVAASLRGVARNGRTLALISSGLLGAAS